MDDPSLITVCRSAADLEQRAAEEIVRVMNAAINDRGMCFVALAGGETPRHCYRHLGMDPLKDRVDWSRVHLFFTDERPVPPNDSQSNFGMVERSLILPIDIPRLNVHRIKGEIDIAVAALEYERELRTAFGKRPLRFDLVLLGIGEDGHTASIFPGTDVVEEQTALVRPVIDPDQNIRRVTLTFAIINSAREILFLASGRRKASIVQRVFGTPESAKDLPATMVRPVDGRLRWMLDEEAASQIEPTIGLSLHPTF
jgi:6-phosphogluconolactonase